MTLPANRAVPLLLVAAMILIGSTSTLFWLGSTSLALSPSLVSWPVVLALGTCMALTSINVGIRWLRWHFLVRRFTRRLATRDSLIVYLATLPAIVTPFFVGELARVMILRRRPGTQGSHLTWVWLIERALDAGVLFTFALLAANMSFGFVAVGALVALAVLMFRFLLTPAPWDRVARVAAATLAATVAAWILPAIAFALTVRTSAGPIGLDDGIELFSRSTLVGGVSGLPLGVSVTGSAMIRGLADRGISHAHGQLRHALTNARSAAPGAAVIRPDAVALYQPA